MPTWLTTSKMHPELQLRIRRSVAGKTPLGGADSPRSRALLRGGGLLAMVSLVGFLWTSYQNEQRELRAAQSALLSRWTETRAGLTSTDLSKGKLVAEALALEAKDYLGDLRSDSLEAWLNGVIEERGIYVRLDTHEATERATLSEKVLERRKDALLDCFVNPPTKDDETTLLARVRQVYGGSNLERIPIDPVSNLFLSLAFLDSSFAAQVREAKSRRTLAKLEMSFSEARLPRRVPALRARYLLAALDEPKSAGVASEIDGASRHFARLVVIDLHQGVAIFRTRRELDPSWISEGARFRYALGLDSCRFGRNARLERATTKPGQERQ